MDQTRGLQQAVQEFMTCGGMKTDEFDAGQACLYTGLQLEETAEKLEAVLTGCIDPSVIATIDYHARMLRNLSVRFKQGLHRGDIMRANREALLDADIDLAWVALGAAYSTSCNTAGAIAEVARANLDKFPGGVVTKDVNGKISKPAGWRGPDLSPFVVPAEE